MLDAAPNVESAADPGLGQVCDAVDSGVGTCDDTWGDAVSECPDDYVFDQAEATCVCRPGYALDEDGVTLALALRNGSRA